MGTNRVSLVVGTVAFDDRKIASRRKMKISDSIGGAPWFGARGRLRAALVAADIVGANRCGKSA
jgi:hypothetical protein